MDTAFYLILVLVVAFVAIVVGFRRGFTMQLSSLLGFAFGSVAARVLTPEFAPSFQWSHSWSPSPEFHEFTSNLVCGVSIYIAVYFLFFLLKPILCAAMSVVNIGMFNRIVGSLFSLLKNLLWLSIFFNLYLCFNPDSGLLRYESSNDGNLIAAVMDMTSAILGCNSAEDFAHYHQLKEAKTISWNSEVLPSDICCNFTTEKSVITTKG